MSDISKEIENAKKIIAEQKKRIREAQKSAAKAEGKLRDRQNYILGGALVKLAETDERGVRTIEALLKRLERPADKRAFETFSRLPALSLTEQGGNDEQH
ncbi:mobilization protein [Acetobacter farinalis]|jgi:Pyruvate/2-oxoacid:ferredoxin oxidoreductase gamma subunit|uniref:Mobilization protein n=3 Tax=Acetobacteraceae TaxID=433 RepID=A0ABT3QAL8_9PROT|nr:MULTISPECIES: mobilization protein [Acetobacteraceae]MBF0860465.1 mobilization protein [Gluconobacter vitians]MCE0745491.1 mobilization protein [Acetobacter sicerae]MCX2562320.1 mobilization protein [Acetobacter farinalis]MDF3626267.1 mobilization protein [Brytella acorum]NHO30931.1 mobilization protein [Acetobacter farinalis]